MASARQAAPEPDRPRVVLAELDGIVHPISAEYLTEAIGEADTSGAELVVFVQSFCKPCVHGGFNFVKAFRNHRENPVRGLADFLKTGLNFLLYSFEFLKNDFDVIFHRCSFILLNTKVLARCHAVGAVSG